MSIFQSFQSGVWQSKSGISKMNNKQSGSKERAMPVVLDMHSNPPTLDTSLLEQTKSHSGTSQKAGKPSSEEGGRFWRQLTTMYQTIHKMWAPTVTWVNPHLVDPHLHDPQHLNMQQPHHPPITQTLNPEAPLWFPAEPGGYHPEIIDPLLNPYIHPHNLMQDKGLYPINPHIFKQDQGSYSKNMNPYSAKQGQGYFPQNTSFHKQPTAPPGKFTCSKVDKPLNPEAKEWIPNNYRYGSQPATGSTANSYMNKKDLETSNMNGVHITDPGKIPIPNGLTHPVPEVNGFCEITENEINAVRHSSNAYPIIAKRNKVEHKVDEESETVPTNLKESSPKHNQSLQKYNKSDRRISQNKTTTNCSPGYQNHQIHKEGLYESDGNTDLESRAVKKCESLVGDKSTLVERSSTSNGSCIKAMGGKDFENNESLDGNITAAKNKIIDENRTTTEESKKSLNRSSSVAVKNKNNEEDGTATIESNEISDGYSSEDTAVCTDDLVADRSLISYAKIVVKTSPSPPPSTKSHQDESEKYVKVVQPLPKIFVKDKIYPKEKAPPSVDMKCKSSGLFKSVSKNQKATSKNFLKELRSSAKSPEKNKRINVDFSVCLELPKSPQRASSPKEETTLPLHCSFSISPATLNTSIGSSPDSRNRSVSESSNTSIDSFDIDFVDEIDNQCKKPTLSKGDEVDKVPVVKYTIKECKKQTPPSPKFSNVLACILGYDAESEESDEDDDDDFDDDWDKVSSEKEPIDDTWETFGFGLVVSGTSGTFPCTRVSVCQSNDKNFSKNPFCDISENLAYDSDEDVPVPNVTLNEINKKWEEEIEKDVLGQSERRVQFGDTNVHPMITWSFAHRDARRGPWEQYARDRARFSQRIASLDPILSVVLNPEHRNCVYKKMQQSSWPS